MSLALMDYETGACSLRALNRLLTTSTVGAMAESGSRPVLDVYSTSPSIARGYKIVIVEDTPTVALSTNVEHGLIIGMFDELSRFVCTAQSSSKKTTFEQASKIDDAINTANDIAWLRASLEISMSEIASLFGVTRKAVYDWTNGAKSTNASYIASVKSMIEQELRAELRPYLRQFWDFDEAGGEALVDIFKSGDVRRLEAARVALNALSDTIANYVEKIRSSSNETIVSHLHNHDEYKYF